MYSTSKVDLIHWLLRQAYIISYYRRLTSPRCRGRFTKYSSSRHYLLHRLLRSLQIYDTYSLLAINPVFAELRRLSIFFVNSIHN